jgi:hypothetical protein
LSFKPALDPAPSRLLVGLDLAGFAIAIPISVPTDNRSCLIAGKLRLKAPEMMTEDAKFALGF